MTAFLAKTVINQQLLLRNLQQTFQAEIMIRFLKKFRRCQKITIVKAIASFNNNF